MVDRPPRDDSQQILATGFNLVIEILMVDRKLIQFHLHTQHCFNLVIEILMVDRNFKIDAILKFI